MINPGFLYVKSLFLGDSHHVQTRRKRELLVCPKIRLVGRFAQTLGTLSELHEGGRQRTETLFTDRISHPERKSRHGSPHVSLQECLGTPFVGARWAAMTFEELLEYELT